MRGQARWGQQGRLLLGHSILPLISQAGISLSRSSASMPLPQDGRTVALKGHRLCGAGSNMRAVPLSCQLGRIAPQMLLLCPLPKLGSDTAPNASSHPSPLGTGIPLILHTPRGSKEQFRCVFFFPSRSVHPRNKLPCEKGFEASQETARSFSRFGNFSCLCLSNT